MNFLEKCNFLLNIFKSFYSIIFINFQILFYKYILKKKLLLFYHPKPLLTKIHNFYITDLLKSKNNNFKILFGYQPHNLLNKNIKNFYIIKQSFLKLIFNVDIFLSLNICDVFPNNSIKIYLHHSIYDTPLASKKKEKDLIRRFSNYNYLFVASDQAANIFVKLFNNIKTNIPKIYEVGYPRLDYIYKNNIKKKLINRIIIAPTGIKSFPNLSIQNYLIRLIHFLRKLNKYKITYRPHPSDIKSQSTLNIKKVFKNEPLFEFDTSDNYFNIYRNSNFLITDLSGTAYTYALLTNNPIIFFSKNENYIKRTYYKNLNYFKNRNKIGKTITNFNQLKNAINQLEINRQKYNIEINKIRKNIKYLGKSKKRIMYLLNQLC